MNIQYNTYSIILKIEKEVSFPMLPSFLFRSIMGNELRKLTCLFKKRSCEDCDLKFQCPYSFVFETPIKKDTSFLSGRNIATHPFVISTDVGIKEKATDLTLSITLIGKAVDYFPYIFYAFKQAGEEGILRDRIKYAIRDIKLHDKSILQSDGSIDINNETEHFSVDTSLRGKRSQQIVIQAKTPIRMKAQGKYISNITYDSVINAVLRKMNILSSMYGKTDKNEKVREQLNKFTYDHQETANFQWLDLHRYSARQRNNMKMGGIVGSLILEGKFTPLERSILKAAELFHIGKNVSFGLGKIEVKGM